MPVDSSTAVVPLAPAAAVGPSGTAEATSNLSRLHVLVSLDALVTFHRLSKYAVSGRPGAPEQRLIVVGGVPRAVTLLPFALLFMETVAAFGCRLTCFTTWSRATATTVMKLFFTSVAALRHPSRDLVTSSMGSCTPNGEVELRVLEELPKEIGVPRSLASLGLPVTEYEHAIIVDEDPHRWHPLLGPQVVVVSHDAPPAGRERCPECSIGNLLSCGPRRDVQVALPTNCTGVEALMCSTELLWALRRVMQIVEHRLSHPHLSVSMCTAALQSGVFFGHRFALQLLTEQRQQSESRRARRTEPGAPSRAAANVVHPALPLIIAAHGGSIASDEVDGGPSTLGKSAAVTCTVCVAPMQQPDDVHRSADPVSEGKTRRLSSPVRASMTRRHRTEVAQATAAQPHSTAAPNSEADPPGPAAARGVEPGNSEVPRSNACRVLKLPKLSVVQAVAVEPTAVADEASGDKSQSANPPQAGRVSSGSSTRSDSVTDLSDKDEAPSGSGKDSFDGEDANESSSTIEEQGSSSSGGSSSRSGSPSSDEGSDCERSGDSGASHTPVVNEAWIMRSAQSLVALPIVPGLPDAQVLTVVLLQTTLPPLSTSSLPLHVFNALAQRCNLLPLREEDITMLEEADPTLLCRGETPLHDAGDRVIMLLRGSDGSPYVESVRQRISAHSLYLGTCLFDALQRMKALERTGRYHDAMTQTGALLKVDTGVNTEAVSSQQSPTAAQAVGTSTAGRTAARKRLSASAVLAPSEWAAQVLSATSATTFNPPQPKLTTPSPLRQPQPQPQQHQPKVMHQEQPAVGEAAVVEVGSPKMPTVKAGADDESPAVKAEVTHAGARKEPLVTGSSEANPKLLEAASEKMRRQPSRPCASTVEQLPQATGVSSMAPSPVAEGPPRHSYASSAPVQPYFPPSDPEPAEPSTQMLLDMIVNPGPRPLPPEENSSLFFSATGAQTSSPSTYCSEKSVSSNGPGPRLGGERAGAFGSSATVNTRGLLPLPPPAPENLFITSSLMQKLDLFQVPRSESSMDGMGEFDASLAAELAQLIEIAPPRDPAMPLGGPAPGAPSPRRLKVDEVDSGIRQALPADSKVQGSPTVASLLAVTASSPPPYDPAAFARESWGEEASAGKVVNPRKRGQQRTEQARPELELPQRPPAEPGPRVESVPPTVERHVDRYPEPPRSPNTLRKIARAAAATPTKRKPKNQFAIEGGDYVSCFIPLDAGEEKLITSQSLRTLAPFSMFPVVISVQPGHIKCTLRNPEMARAFAKARSTNIGGTEHRIYPLRSAVDSLDPTIAVSLPMTSRRKPHEAVPAGPERHLEPTGSRGAPSTVVNPPGRIRDDPRPHPASAKRRRRSSSDGDNSNTSGNEYSSLRTTARRRHSRSPGDYNHHARNCRKPTRRHRDRSFSDQSRSRSRSSSSSRSDADSENWRRRPEGDRKRSSETSRGSTSRGVGHKSGASRDTSVTARETAAMAPSAPGKLARSINSAAIAGAPKEKPSVLTDSEIALLSVIGATYDMVVSTPTAIENHAIQNLSDPNLETYRKEILRIVDKVRASRRRVR